MFIGAIAQGEFSDRWGRKTVYQFNLLVFGVFTILGALAPTVWWLVAARFIAGLGLGGEQPLAFAYAGEYSPKAIRGRILAFVHFVGGACVWPIAHAVHAVLPGSDHVARHLGRDRHRRADRLGVPLRDPGIAAFPGHPRQGQRSARCARAHGYRRADRTAHNRRREQYQIDPFALVFKMFPKRVIAGMICFSAFFGVAIGLGNWLPNMMHDRGFTITKSLTFILGMNLAVPCASIFMMYALDKYGRKITAVCSFIGAGIMAIVFANAGSPTQLLIFGFVMVFFIQVSGNSMQIFASEVFPTNARASGFGWAAGVGRLSTAGIVVAIPYIQNNWGMTAVFVCIAIVLVIAAVSVTQMGPEARQKGLDEIAPPTG